MFQSELQLLRKTKNENGQKIPRNNRPVQPLNGRVVYSYWLREVNRPTDLCQSLYCGKTFFIFKYKISIEKSFYFVTLRSTDR